MLIDTHAHLFDARYEGILPEVIARAYEAGVEKIIVPGLDLATSRKAVELAQSHEGYIYAAVGIHPEEASASLELRTTINELHKLIDENRGRVVAIGEVGTDLHNESQLITRQKELLKEQAKMAKEYELPMIVHTRQSVGEALEVLDEAGIERAQFHCFAGTEEEMEQILARGYYISFCGNVSWSKRVRRMSAKAPLERLLVETDSPYMTPRDTRGETVTPFNEPKNVKINARIQASEREIDESMLIVATRENVRRVYGI